MLDVNDLHHHNHLLYTITPPPPLVLSSELPPYGRLSIGSAHDGVGDEVKTHQIKDLSPTSLLTSLNTLLEPMFPLPSSLGNLLLPSPLLGPVIQIAMDLVVGLKN